MPLFKFGENELTAVTRRSMAELNILERADLQRLLKENINAISQGTLVISEEYTGWVGSLRRIDLLGIDPDGTLVVFELKRTEDGGHMDLQGIRYAAMASLLSFKEVVAVYSAFLEKCGRDGDAEELLRNHLESEGDDFEAQVAAKVRIVLASADFGQEITTTALWLNGHGLDIRCVKMVPYEDGDSRYLDVQQIIPVPEAADYLIKLREKEERKEVARQGERDFTKYRVTVGVETVPGLDKGRAILAVVRGLHGRGVSPEVLRDTINQIGLQRFYEIEGEVFSEDDFVAAAGLSADLNNGKPFRALRYFTADSDLIRHEGKTYAFSNQWGRFTESKMSKLVACHGGGAVGFTKEVG